jgi:hypothetical protein
MTSLSMKAAGRYILIVIAFASGNYLASAQANQSNKTARQYIQEFREDAIREMHEGGIPASITLAQGIQESNSGNSPLALHANNHFGIKCTKEWNGPFYIQDDDKKDECFRKYETVYDSYADHSSFLKSRPRYAFLFQIPVSDYKGWANGLKSSGYATDPSYARRLIKIIEDYELYNLDTIKPIPPELVASVDNYFKSHEPKIQRHDYAPAVEKSVLPYVNHEIEYINGRKCISTRSGETLNEIGSEYDIDPRLIYKYNDLENDKKARFKPGMIIFLQPKRNKAQEDFHTLQSGETMYSVSQKYGIKLKKLYRKNRIEQGTEPDKGTILWLRRSKKA